MKIWGPLWVVRMEPAFGEWRASGQSQQPVRSLVQRSFTCAFTVVGRTNWEGRPVRGGVWSNELQTEMVFMSSAFRAILELSGAVSHGGSRLSCVRLSPAAVLLLSAGSFSLLPCLWSVWPPLLTGWCHGPLPGVGHSTTCCGPSVHLAPRAPY